jgi:DNA-binding IclR family transcriptional regulator
MSLANAAAVLHWLKRDHEDVAVGELSVAMGWPKSSASRLLKDMATLGLLERDPVTRRYRPGLLMLELGRRYTSGEPLIEVVDAKLRELTLRTGYSSGISILDGTDIVVLRSRPGTNPLRVVTPPGTRGPAWANSTGRCLLARLPDAEIAARFTPFPSGGRLEAPSSLPALMERIRETRRRGWDISNDESLLGVSGISIAIADPDGSIAFSPYFAFSAAQVSQPERQELADMLIDMAARLGVQPKPAPELLDPTHA